jgi:hypothetical protein
MTEEQVARLAAGLTKAQRLYTITEARSIGNPPIWIACSDYALDARSTTLSALIRAGVLHKTRFGLAFTPLGLAIRAHLAQEKPDATC